MPASIPPIPPGTDLKANQGPRIIAAMIALLILPTVFVILRFVSRKIARAGLWWDDALVTAAMVLGWGSCVCVIVSTKTNSFGKHLWALPNPAHNTRTFLLILYIYVVFYYVGVVTVKLGIIAFYRRIFPVASLKIPMYVASLVVIIYGATTIFVNLFQCSPIHYFWDKTMDPPGKCLDTDNILLVTGALNAVIDFLIIGLPIPFIWKLRTTTAQKSVLTGIFICAGFVCIIGIIRVVVLSRLTNFDVTWNYVDSAIWSAAEPCMGVIAACIPSLRPLFSWILRGTYRGPTLHGSKPVDVTASTNSSRYMWSRRDKHGDDMDQIDSKGFTRLEDMPPSSPRWGHDAHIMGGREKRRKKSMPGTENRPSLDQISLEEMVPQGGIKVKSEIVVTTSDWEYKDRVF